MQLFKLLFLAVILFSSSTDAKNSLEDFFSSGGYNQVKISPSGEYYSITYSEGTEVKLVILNRETNKVMSSFAFGDYKKIKNVTWVNNERFIMSVQKTVGYLDTKGGAAFYVASNFDGKKRREILASQTSIIRIISLLPDDDDHILITKQHFKDEFAVKLHKVNVYTGELNYLADQPKQDVFGMIADVKGNPRIAFKYEEDDDDKLGEGEVSIYFKEKPSSDWQQLNLNSLSYKPGDSLSFLGMNKKGNIAYLINDSKREKSAVFSFNLITKKLKIVISNKNVDIDTAIYGPQGDVIGVTYDPNYPKYFYFNEGKEAKTLKKLSDTFNAYRLTFTSHSIKSNLAVFKISADKTPNEFYLYDINSKKASYIASSNNKVDKSILSTVEPFTISARDGITLHGYLTLPVGKGEKQLPGVVMVHGGPHGVRDFWGFNSEAQYIASLGYAVIQVNFRGSGGYGKEFLKSGFIKWGHEMQDDVTDATLWAIDQGIVNKDKLCIYGGSYGGYAALMGVVREPDLYKCAIGYVGVYSLPEMFKSGDTSESESGKKFLKMVHGENETDQKRRSPAFNVAKIKAKLFIAHGADDVRVPIEQYEALTNALDEIDYPYESMVRDEGHGYHKQKNRIDFYTKMADFLAASLNP
ncbi:S9 family peptidase [Pseudoalteromonas sp. NEC-BIFX-2020_015]|uniref:alpha/beta hydrolase family protein n=1 Tax=Pseudoalteromonas sp. NEC-BIFX-2020_015 TaxID=2729544 RepID=UPI001461494A|nr:prolyl oligopeptidase family serine peptidase [Pseudoalteromonas sp. NEC-BIFX-2020_015]NMR27761.1 S9 family peptidase [Pseudoalteromonas sp. NEC-BIFX-2020_015]